MFGWLMVTFDPVLGVALHLSLTWGFVGAVALLVLLAVVAQVVLAARRARVGG